MKYQYYQDKYGARVEPYYCDNYWCSGIDCDCGLSFEEAKEMVVSHYENRLEWAKSLKEED